MFFSKNKKINNQSGFTMIEMLIAVLIFSLSLTSLMTIAGKGLKTAKEAEQQVIADYLAIEGVEIIRNLRDSAFLRNLKQTSWELVFQGGDIFSDQGCYNGTNTCNVYFPSSGSPVLDTCTNCTVFVSKNNFYYRQTLNDILPAGFIDSGFSRKIRIKEISKSEVVVVVEVSWDGGSVVYSENLFLWQ